MWLYFNSRGQLVKLVEESDAPARVGTHNFQIFAVFEGLTTDTTTVEENNSFKIATIKLRKPDLDGSEYPLLLMDKTTKTYVGQTNDKFQYNTEYKGFLFDFGNFNTNQQDETLLDTPGLWEAIITVAGNNRSNSVQGVAKFNVEGSGGSQDGYEMTIDEVLDNLYDEFLPMSGGTLTGDVSYGGQSFLLRKHTIKIVDSSDSNNFIILTIYDRNGQSINTVDKLFNRVYKEDNKELYIPCFMQLDDDRGMAISTRLDYTQGGTTYLYYAALFNGNFAENDFAIGSVIDEVETV